MPVSLASNSSETEQSEIVPLSNDKSDEQIVSPPPHKKPRFDLDQNWYASKEKSMSDALNSAVQQAQKCNKKSWKHIKKLQEEVNLLREEKESLEKSSEKEKQKFELIIKQMQEDNDTLRKNAKICRNCGAAVNPMLFCSPDCQNMIEYDEH